MMGKEEAGRGRKNAGGGGGGILTGLGVLPAATK
jgi:hypothetical protein